MTFEFEPIPRQIPLEKVYADPHNPRKSLDLVVEDYFKESLRLHGLLLPIIVSEVNGMFCIRDGHRRVAGLRAIGVNTALAVFVKPGVSEFDIRLVATLLNTQRSNLVVMDKAEAWKHLQVDQHWSLSELAKAVSEDLGTVSKTLSLLKLIPEAQALLRQGWLKYIRGYEWSKLSADEQRKRVEKLIAEREGNSTLAKPAPLKRVACPLQSGITITVSGKELTMEDFLFSLEFVLKEARKNKSKGMDVTTLGKLFQDQAKQGGVA